jgi:hypothetical protein
MRIQVTAKWNHRSVSTTGSDPDASRPNHRVKYLVAVAVSITVTIAAVSAVTVDAPGRICPILCTQCWPLDSVFVPPAHAESPLRQLDSM